MTIQQAMQIAEAWRQRNWRWLRWGVVAVAFLVLGAVFL